MGSQVAKASLGAQRRLWSDCASVHADPFAVRISSLVEIAVPRFMYNISRSKGPAKTAHASTLKWFCTACRWPLRILFDQSVTIRIYLQSSNIASNRSSLEWFSVLDWYSNLHSLDKLSVVSGNEILFCGVACTLIQSTLMLPSSLRP